VQDLTIGLKLKNSFLAVFLLALKNDSFGKVFGGNIVMEF